MVQAVAMEEEKWHIWVAGKKEKGGGLNAPSPTITKEHNGLEDIKNF